MKTQFKPWMLTGLLLLNVPFAAHAQETLGGLGAAGAAGAALGAGGAGATLAAGSNARRGIGRSTGSMGGMDMGSEMDGGGDGRMGGSGSMGDGSTGGAAAPATKTPPPAQSFGGTGADYVRELLAAPSPPLTAINRTKRSPRSQARYATRTSRKSKAQRTREVQAKYKIPPINWLAAYLPQDRYKFGKIWRFVSTEDDRFYYAPSAMARKRFNPNRVIGFNSYQDALAAGYRPDPVSKPAPGAQIAYIARLYRGPELYSFVEYVYSGQISAQAVQAAYDYAANVNRALSPTRARPYIGSTVAKILAASLNGDYASIPTEFTSSGPVLPPPPTTNTGGSEGGEGGDPRMGSSSPQGGSGGSGGRSRM